MFDIGFWELCLIGVLALIILGPERLPQVARTAGLWMGRARRFLADVKADIDREIREGELSAVRDLRDDLRDAGKDLAKAQQAMNESVDAPDGKSQETAEEVPASPSSPPADAPTQDEVIDTGHGKPSGDPSAIK